MEGEATPELDQVGRGDIKATREEEDTSDQDQVDQGNIGATREGEDNPKLDQVARGDIKVTTKEEEKHQAKTNQGQEKNTKEEQEQEDQEEEVHPNICQLVQQVPYTEMCDLLHGGVVKGSTAEELVIN